MKSSEGTVEKSRQLRSHCSKASTYAAYASPFSLLAALLDGLFEQSLFLLL